MIKKKNYTKLDLINRQELYNQIRLYLNRSRLGETSPTETLTIGEIAGIISDMPGIDAVLTQSFKWEINETENQKYEYRCPNCGARHFTRRLYHQNYCGYCGAHMLEENDK